MPQAQPGFRIPADIQLCEDAPDNKITTGQLFSAKRVVLIGVMGAFTPNCNSKHLPEYVRDFDKFREKGVDEIICLSVNDPFVTCAWKECCQCQGRVRVVADPHANFAKALGLEMDMSEHFGVAGGVRLKRFSALVDDGEIKILNVEPDGGGLTCSLSQELLKQIPA